MTGSPLLVLYVPAGGGHRAAAEAIAEAARLRGEEALCVDALSLAPRWFARAYVDAHFLGSRLAPALYGGLFEGSNHHDPVRDELRRALDEAVGEGLRRFVLEMRPRAVIATHFYPLTELGRLRRQGALVAPLVAVVTDLVTHALWSVPGVDLYCTAEGTAAHHLAGHGTHGAPIVRTGIPIRPEMNDLPVSPVPASEGEPLSVLVTSGGFGVGPVLEVLRSFRGTNAQLDVVCGASPSLVDRARRLAAELALDAVVTGYVRDMPARMARAHVVVGKPGGLTVSEALACGRPLVAVGAVPGQETGNLRQLVSWGCAVACPPHRVGRTVAALHATGRLPAMSRAARAHGAPRAALRVLECLRTPGQRAA